MRQSFWITISLHTRDGNFCVDINELFDELGVYKERKRLRRKFMVEFALFLLFNDNT